MNIFLSDHLASHCSSIFYAYTSSEHGCASAKVVGKNLSTKKPRLQCTKIFEQEMMSFFHSILGYTE